MSADVIALHEPKFNQKDIDLVADTLRTAWVSTGGKYVELFEQQFAEYIGKQFAVTLSSGTVALQIAIECLKKKYGVTKNFEIIIPNLTFIATANAVIHAGGTLVLADSAPNRFNVDKNSILKILNDKYVRDDQGKWINYITKARLLAIMPVHVMGWLGDVEEIIEFSREMGIDVIEDAAESLGTKYLDGNHSGKNSLISCYSFNGNKILTTGGGGMLCTDDEWIAKKAKHLTTTAKTDGLRFIHDEVGYNFRLVNILAALGCSQLEELELNLELKRKIFFQYHNFFSEFDGVNLYREEGCKQNNWINNLIFDDFNSKEKVMKILLDENIQVRPIWTPIDLQPAFADQLFDRSANYNSHNLWKKSLSIPSSSHLENHQIERICKKIKIGVSI